MRLLKTGPYVPGDEKIEVIEKWGKAIPEYAILSHTWSTSPADEVLLSDVQNFTCGTKPAFQKLKKALDQARHDGWGWLWIDTCCIDKISSVELSEAINSMYDYYKNSQKCYAYLADVESDKEGPRFEDSRWWKRGWTLQELLAPKEVEFFDTSWRFIGDKHSLHKVISEKTGIESEYLTRALPIEHASIAKRMSWAASRETTRDEDIAYSMIGLFDVNMPMLYGEGATKAFIRLQEEILRVNEDQSLFAWVNLHRGQSLHGLLADSPKDFEHTGNTISYSELDNNKPSTMTARGLNLSLPLIEKSNKLFIAALHCPRPGKGNGWLAVYLEKLNTGSNQYARVDCDKLASVVEQGLSQEIYIRQRFPDFPDFAYQGIYPYHYFQLRSLAVTSDYSYLRSYKIVNSIAKPPTTESSPVMAQNPLRGQPQPWSAVSMVYTIDKTAGNLTTALQLKRTFDEEEFVIMLGARPNFDIGVAVSDDISLANGIGYAEVQPAFNPQNPGEYVKLKYHGVRVKAEERIRENQKIYFVDIEIEAYPTPPTKTDLLEAAVESIVPGQGRSTARKDFRDKVKRRFLPTSL